MSIRTRTLSYFVTTAIPPHRIAAFADAAGTSIRPADATDKALVGTVGKTGASAGGMGDVDRGGIARVELGGTVAAGDPLTSDANARAVKTTTSGQRTIGRAEEPGVAGDWIDYMVGPEAITGTAAAAQPAIAFVVTVIAVTEGNSGTKTVSNQINVTRAGISGPLTINLAYSGTADSSDFSGPVSVTIAANASSLTFDITVNGDTAVEQDETIVIDASLAGYGATARKTITITNDDTSGTPQMIGGLAVGTVATDGPMAGLMMTTGNDFDGPLSIIGPAARDRFNDHLSTRGVYIPKAAGQAPRSSEGLGGVDADPNWTGHNNSNRGAPITSMADMITQTNGKIILKQRPMLDSEKAHVLRNNRSVLSSMLSTALKDLMRAPGAFEWEEKRNTIAQDHFTGWSMDRISFSMNEIETDAEAGSHPDGTGDGRDIEYNINAWADGTRQGNRSSGGEVLKVDHSVTHRHFINHTAEGVIECYLDGVLKRTFAAEPALVLRYLKQLIFTAHMYDVDRPQVETTYEILWYRFWAKYGHFKPAVPPIVIQAAAGVPFNVALPSATTLWGRAVAEEMQAVMCEPNEPGGTVNGIQYGDAPPGFTLDKTNPSVSGSSMTPGRVQFGRAADEPGYTSGVHRFVVEIGPVINITELNVTQGVPVDIDIYSMIDFGILVTDGAKPNTVITISPLPTGLEFSNATGRLTGMTTAGVGSQPMTISATNGVGQQITATPPLMIGAKPVEQAWAYQSWAEYMGEYDGGRDASFASQTGAFSVFGNPVSSAFDLFKPAKVTPLPQRLTSQLNGRAATSWLRGADGLASTVLESGQDNALTKILLGTDSFSFTLALLIKPVGTGTGLVGGWSEQISTSLSRQAGLVRRHGIPSSFRCGSGSADLNIGILEEGKWYLVIMRHTAAANGNPAFSDVWVNDTKVVDAVAHSSNTVWTSAQRFSFGNMQAGTGTDGRYPATAFDGLIANGIPFNGAISDAKVAQLVSDMKAKWKYAA